MYDGTNFKGHDAQLILPLRTDADLDALIRRAQAARAAAIAKIVSDVVGWVRDRRAAMRAERELLELDPRLLQDIGIRHDEIKALIHGAPRVAAQARGEMLVDFVSKYIVEPFKRWEMRARTRDELMALDDVMLRDIGIERGQIEGIALAVADGKTTERDLRASVTQVAGPVTVSAGTAANSNERRFALVDAAD